MGPELLNIKKVKEHKTMFLRLIRYTTKLRCSLETDVEVNRYSRTTLNVTEPFSFLISFVHFQVTLLKGINKLLRTSLHFFDRF
jgi:hypothetical protein